MDRKRLLNILIVLTLCFIWGNSMVSKTVSARISDSVLDGINWCAEKLGLGADFFTVMLDQDGDGLEEPTSYLIRKIAHVTEFSVLSALLWLRLEDRGRKRIPLTVLFGVAAAAADEIIQIFSHRGSQIQDVLIDSGGVLLGLGIALALSALRRKKAVAQAAASI